MSILDMANTFIEMVRNNETERVLSELYAPDAVSVEAAAMEDRPRAVEGVAAIRGKHAWWDETFEVHDASVEGPFPHGDDRFAVIYGIKATHKPSGQTSDMREVGVYHVADNKIVREEFFYPSGA
ncbi:MAG: nuclear transport factor 2 family protein [Pseudomonadota bacterium]